MRDFRRESLCEGCLSRDCGRLREERGGSVVGLSGGMSWFMLHGGGDVGVEKIAENFIIPLPLCSLPLSLHSLTWLAFF